MKADIKALIAKITNTPLIVEQGTDGIWIYRKWSNGIAECWGTVDQRINGWTAWYSWYYSTPYNVKYDFPAGLFTSPPSLECTKVYGAAGSLISEFAVSSTKTPAFYLIRPDAGATGTYGLSFYAIGKWK